MNAAYTVITQSGTINGEIKASGDKFHISSPQLSTWFDGKTQWTYSPADNEVTVSEPTPEELTMINPFEIINTLRHSFTASTASAGKSRTSLLLKAIDKTSEISQVTLNLDSSTLFPVRIELTTRSGKITINLSGVKKGTKPGVSEFRFNKALYPGVMVNDMR